MALMIVLPVETKEAEELSERMLMPEDKIRKVLKIAKEPISMETPIGDDEVCELKFDLISIHLLLSLSPSYPAPATATFALHPRRTGGPHLTWPCGTVQRPPHVPPPSSPPRASL